MSDKQKPLLSTERFTDRVENYVKFRPTYPIALVDFLCEKAGLAKEHVIADIGAGTGILSAVLLKEGYKVIAVEPNAAMRLAADEQLAGYSAYSSIDGTGEKTNLPAKSVDLITMAQAFHWMNPLTTRTECLRILKPKGHVALIWNLRQNTTPFMKGFEKLKQDFGNNYKDSVRADETSITQFYDHAPILIAEFPNPILLDYEQLKGQLLSSSYIPLEGERHTDMLKALKQLFQQNQESGLVRIEFATKVYLNNTKF